MTLTRRWLGPLLGALLAALLAGCGGDDPGLPRLGAQDVLLAFGDSLTHGTGAAPEQSYPAQLGALIGRPVVNAGVPGETTEQGLRRLPEVLQRHAPRILLLCLGGNDFLRGGAASAEANLAAMIELARAQGVAVVLIGVPEPKLLGGVADLYPRLAERYALPFEGEALNQVLRQASLKADPVHPNAQGYARIAQSLAELLREAGALE
ncbi:MAG: arylesterase [Betaproteobacteria bacterium]|nr:arylesterase [Betaproteobacteria bacterium]